MVPSGLLLRSDRNSGTSTNRSECSAQYAARQFWNADRIFSLIGQPTKLDEFGEFAVIAVNVWVRRHRNQSGWRSSEQSRKRSPGVVGWSF